MKMFIGICQQTFLSLTALGIPVFINAVLSATAIKKKLLFSYTLYTEQLSGELLRYVYTA